MQVGRMKHPLVGPSLALALALLALVVGLPLAVRAQGPAPRGATAALGTAFTYQGRLTEGGSPANGTYDFQFKLYDAGTGGSQVGSTVTKSGVSVSEGLFSVELDFGSGAFDGNARWLEVAVKKPSESSYTTLGRQKLTAAPYALALPGLRTEPNATSPNVIGGYSGNSVGGGAEGATIGGGGSADNTCGSGTSPCINQVNLSYATVSGGKGNTANGLASTVGGGESNDAAGGWSTVGGGINNQTLLNASTVGGGRGNAAVGTATTVGGGENNTASAEYTTVGGGSDNLITATYGTIAGGYNITVTGQYATVGGGSRNIASGFGSTVSGGSLNQATGVYATVAGGGGYLLFWPAPNQAEGDWATVSGGFGNQALGFASTIPGGGGNKAAGDYSFAAGYRARANHSGTFVWGDNTDADINSPMSSTFIVRANNGIWFGQATSDFTPTIGSYTFISTSTGAYLHTGGVWINASDRNLKENFEPVDPQAVLEQVAQLPITTWNYKVEDPSVRHLGPVAQDFYAAFGLGADDTHIASLDASGVALAAIQGLYRQNQEQAARLEALERENAELRKQIDAIEAQLAGLNESSGAAKGAWPFRFWSGFAFLVGLGFVWAWRRGNERD